MGFLELSRFLVAGGQRRAAEASIANRLTRYGLDHLVVVVERHLPDVARARSAVRAHCLGVVVGHAGEKKSGVAPASPRRDIGALDQHDFQRVTPQVVQKADPGDSATDHEHVGPFRQPARVALDGPRPVRGQVRGPNNIELRHAV